MQGIKRPKQIFVSVVYWPSCCKVKQDWFLVAGLTGKIWNHYWSNVMALFFNLERIFIVHHINVNFHGLNTYPKSMAHNGHKGIHIGILRYV